MTELIQDKKQVYARISQLLQAAQYLEAERLCNLVIKDGESDQHYPWFFLGVARQFQGHLEPALEAFESASVLSPDSIDILNARASCLEQLGRIEEAYLALQQAYHLAPTDAMVCANLAVALEKMSKPDEALKYYDLALGFDARNHVALTNRGTLLSTMGKRRLCLQHNRFAYEIFPEQIETLYNLTDAHIGLHQYEEALALCELGLSRQPLHSHLMFKKGLVLSCLRRFEEGQAALSMAQVIYPKVIQDMLPRLRTLKQDVSIYIDARLMYFDGMYQEQARCFWNNRETYLLELKQAIFHEEDVYRILRNKEFGFQSFSLALDAQTRLALSRAMSECVKDYVWLTGCPPFLFQDHKHQKLRIGYVSPDFRTHPVGLLSRQIYELHDKSRFEVFAYSLFTPEGKDKVRDSIQSSCSVFRDVGNLSDVEIAQQIKKDEIDILIDLAGYTTYSRTELFVLRPAPAQVSYLGYPGTTGADFMDYAIVDAVVCPPTYEKDWQEKIVRLPNAYCPYDTAIDNSPITSNRQDHGLPEKGFIFCCFNTSYKIEPEVFSVWMNILKSVPDSVLWLVEKDTDIAANLQDEAAARGVGKERLIFAKILPHADHWPRYQLADLFLDTFWHNAHTTAADALWQGLPVLTCAGEVASSRLAASLLHALGMQELVTENMQQYQELAIYYATHQDVLFTVREKLKAARHNAPLFDMPRTVRNLEHAYRLIWQHYQDGLPPAIIKMEKSQ